MKKRALILLVLISISVTATNDWIFNSDEITADVIIHADMEIDKESSDYSVDYLKVNLTFFPRDTNHQEVRSFYTEPQAITDDDTLVFTFQNPTAGTKEINLNSTVISKNRLYKVQDKVEFPIDIAENLIPYTMNQDVIDSDNPEIIAMANELATGEDDLLVILHKISSWIHENIEYEYDTDSDIAKYSKKASWVLRNKRGVCDEYTGLFIAMTRSLGIPSRYISGVAYTNMLNINDWGPHAWAEIYTPGYGWIPYDVTYGQTGFIDASHIKLKESMDSDESAVSYQWKYQGAKLTTSSLDIKTTLVKPGKQMSPLVEQQIKPLKDKVGFGSYNLIELTIRNLRGYYVSTGIQLAETEELETEGEMDMIILLKPFESKKYYWIVRTADNLDSNYIYTIPLYVQSTRNATAESSFSSSRNAPSYTRDEILALWESLERRETKTYTKKLEFNCSTAKDSYYTYESTTVKCSVKNKGNTVLNKIAACNDVECHELDLGIGATKYVEFDINFDSPGMHDYIFTTGNAEISTDDILTIDVYDPPKISIIDKEMTGTQEFGSNITLSANLRKTSYSTPENLRVVYSIGDTELSMMRAKEITIDQKYQLKLSTDMLPSTNNRVQFTVTYEDKNKKQYELHDEFEININNITFTQRIVLVLNKIELWFQGLF